MASSFAVASSINIGTISIEIPTQRMIVLLAEDLGQLVFIITYLICKALMLQKKTWDSIEWQPVNNVVCL